jgi:hypothetical protein
VDPRVDRRAWFETARAGETADGGPGVPAWAGKAIINYRRKKDDAEFRSSLSGTRADAMISRVRAAHAVVVYGTRTTTPSGTRLAHNPRVLLFQANSPIRLRTISSANFPYSTCACGRVLFSVTRDVGRTLPRVLFSVEFPYSTCACQTLTRGSLLPTSFRSAEAGAKVVYL